MTMDFGVRMPELEVCIIVVKAPDQPGVGIVAVCAFLSQPKFVYIIGAMAVITGSAGVAKHGGGMAGLAAEYSMLADEWKTAQVMVESNFMWPGNFIMALVTFVALLIFMDIVLFVAAVTDRINFFGFGANCMTCLACQIFVRAVECEIGVCIVVKFCIDPSSDDMTVLAFFTIQLVMNIIGTMAAVTVTRFFVAFFRNLVIVRMTVIAGLPTVSSFEFVFGIPVMVENRLIPALLLMAACTFIAEAVVMNIPYRMAIDALRWSIFVFLVDVAGIASYLLV